MSNTRRRRRGLWVIAVLFAASASVPGVSLGGGQESSSLAIEIRVATEFEKDDDLRIRSQMIGCDPCRQVSLASGERYLVSPAVVTSIPISEVKVAYVGAGAQTGPNARFELILQLSDDGAKRLRATLPEFVGLVMNFYAGRPLGVSVALPFDDTYGIGSFTSDAAAKKVAADMGVRVEEIPFDDEAVRRYLEQVEQPGPR